MNLSKLILAFPALILLSLYCSCNKSDKHIIYDNNLEILHGKVKQIRAIESGFNNDTVIVDFNPQGYIFEVAVSGSKVSKWSYKFDKNGKPTEAIENNGELPHLTGKYDQFGRLAELIFYTKEWDNVLKQSKYSYTYDADGCLVSCNVSLVGGEIKNLLKHKYDKQHLLIEQGQYNVPVVKGPIRKLIYKYLVMDKKGNWLKRLIIKDTDPNDVDTITRTITYY